MKKLHLLVATAGVFVAATGASLAQTAVVATTDLNVRAGPGPQYPVVGVVGANQQVPLEGCVSGSKWCQVSVNGQPGWAYSDYLAGEFATGGTSAVSQRVVVTERPAEAVPVIEYDETTAATNAQGGGVAGATAGVATGAVAGALIGGPVGAAIGGVVGATGGGVIGEAVAPTPVVKEYVVQNQVDPVYLDGEVVVGAGVPDTVALQPVPDYQYQYAYINGQPVLIDPATRQIVYVVR